ncbi:MAG TPA: PaaI family thioesterase [Bacteroidales bacterium]|nr:PaaI family thioesterase [Bacteroidales bacterium]
MNRKIHNPYDREQNKCFGCSVSNPIGLRLSFIETEEYIEAKWMPGEFYQGYPNILHGGIIASVLDETGGWCVSVKVGTAGVTSEIRIKYLAPVYINKGELTIRAEVIEKSEKMARILCRMFDGQEKLCAEAEAQFFLYPGEIAKRRFRYPGREAFYGSE